MNDYWKEVSLRWDKMSGPLLVYMYFALAVMIFFIASIYFISTFLFPYLETLNIQPTWIKPAIRLYCILAIVITVISVKITVFVRYLKELRKIK